MWHQEYIVKQACNRAELEKDAAGFFETLMKLPKGLMQLGQAGGAIGEAGGQLGKDVAGAAGSAIKGALGGGMSPELKAMQEAQAARMAAKAKLMQAGQGIRANIPPNPGM